LFIAGFIMGFVTSHLNDVRNGFHDPFFGLSPLVLGEASRVGLLRLRIGRLFASQISQLLVGLLARMAENLERV